jgi:amidophosphoribosyltransferase
MFPCKFNLSTRKADELVARRAIKDIEGQDTDDISEYTNPESSQYQEMVEWIRKDIDVTTLRYQTIDDLVSAIGLPREKLCLYCWTGQCPQKAAQSKLVQIGASGDAQLPLAANA